MKNIIILRLAFLCLVLLGTVSCGSIRPVGGMQAGMMPPPMMAGGQFGQFGQPQLHPGQQFGGQFHQQGGQQIHHQGGRGETVDRGGILQKWDIVDGRPVKSGSATWLNQHPGDTLNGLNVRTNERVVMSDAQFNQFRADFNNPQATDPGFRADERPREPRSRSQVTEEDIQRDDIDIVPYQ